MKKKKLNCMRCGHIWKPRTQVPGCCPKCGSYNFDQPKDRQRILVGIETI